MLALVVALISIGILCLAALGISACLAELGVWPDVGKLRGIRRRGAPPPPVTSAYPPRPGCPHAWEPVVLITGETVGQVCAVCLTSAADLPAIDRAFEVFTARAPGASGILTGPDGVSRLVGPPVEFPRPLIVSETRGGDRIDYPKPPPPPRPRRHPDPGLVTPASARVQMCRDLFAEIYRGGEGNYTEEDLERLRELSRIHTQALAEMGKAYKPLVPPMGCSGVSHPPHPGCSNKRNVRRAADGRGAAPPPGYEVR